MTKSSTTPKTVSSDTTRCLTLKENIFEIPISSIDFNDSTFCFRVDITLNNLKEDIRKNGQLFPVILRKKQGDLFQIISGFRRCTSILELGFPSVKAIVRNISDDEAYYTSYIENERRKNLSGIDKALAISKLAKHGKSAKDIQNLYGIGERQYYRLKRVCNFPKEIKDAISDNFIRISHALVLMEAYENFGSRVDLDDWIDWLLEIRPSVRELKRAIKKKYSPLKPSYINRSDNGFTFKSIKFDPSKSNLTDAKLMLQEIEEAAAIIRDWCNRQ